MEYIAGTRKQLVSCLKLIMLDNGLDDHTIYLITKQGKIIPYTIYGMRVMGEKNRDPIKAMITKINKHEDLFD